MIYNYETYKYVSIFGKRYVSTIFVSLDLSQVLSSSWASLGPKSVPNPAILFCWKSANCSLSSSLARFLALWNICKIKWCYFESVKKKTIAVNIRTAYLPFEVFPPYLILCGDHHLFHEQFFRLRYSNVKAKIIIETLNNNHVILIN